MIHAGRYLCDKEFRYLSTVSDTAAIGPVFDSRRIPVLYNDGHWAHVSPYTSSFDFAETCGFNNQSPATIFCDFTDQGIRVKPSFLRTYGVSLPSSLTMGLSTPESIRPAHQCRFRYGYEFFELFLDQMDPVLPSQYGEKNPESGRPSKKKSLWVSERQKDILSIGLGGHPHP